MFLTPKTSKMRSVDDDHSNYTTNQNFRPGHPNDIKFIPQLPMISCAIFLLKNSGNKEKGEGTS